MAKEKEKKQLTLEEALAKLDKDFGPGSVINGDEILECTEVVSTGSLRLDIALGVGGLPSDGKIIEISGWESSGKSTLIQTICGNFQRKYPNKKVIYVDSEHSLDKVYSTKLGLNLKELIVIQMDEGAGEAAFNKVNTLVNTGMISCVVYDSYNAMQPKKIVDGELGDATMGIHARLMGQVIAQDNAACAKYGTNFIYVGQLREKIGVMFGCFHYDNIVNLADGRNLPIGKIVDEKIKGNVFTINEKTGLIEEKEIVNWFNNGKISKKSDFISILTDSIDGKGKYGITCTKNHKLLTLGNVWKEAKDLTINDKLISKYKEKLNGTLLNFLSGSFIADCSLKINKNKACFSYQDNKNPDYVNWKISKLEPFFNFTKTNIKAGLRFDSEYSTELFKTKELLVNRNPLFLLNNCTDLGLAVLYMDDGHFDCKNSHYRIIISFKRFKNNIYVLDTILNKFKNILYDENITINYKNGNIIFNKPSAKKFFEKIHIFIPKPMQYKLPEEYKNKYVEFSLNNNPIFKTDIVNILSINEGSSRKFRNKNKYDLGIKDNHNYLLGSLNNGIFVHNSPTTTQGGNALKFYAHVRLEASRSITNDNSIKDGDEKIGNKHKVKVIKNKVGPPFKEAEYYIMYGEGIDKYEELIRLAHDYGVGKKYGSSFTYNDVKYDIVNFIENLVDNDELFQEIRQKVLDIALIK